MNFLKVNTMPNTYYPNKDNDFANWLANVLYNKARKNSETSGHSNIAVAGVPIPVPLVV